MSSWAHHHNGTYSEKMRVLLEPMLSPFLLVKIPCSQIFTVFPAIFQVAEQDACTKS